MATVKKETQAKNTKAQNQNNKDRPNNKDTTDSRKNEEYDFKGDDMTNNKKQTRIEK